MKILGIISSNFCTFHFPLNSPEGSLCQVHGIVCHVLFVYSMTKEIITISNTYILVQLFAIFLAGFGGGQHTPSGHGPSSEANREVNPQLILAEEVLMAGIINDSGLGAEAIKM